MVGHFDGVGFPNAICAGVLARGVDHVVDCLGATEVECQHSGVARSDACAIVAVPQGRVVFVEETFHALSALESRGVANFWSDELVDNGFVGFFFFLCHLYGACHVAVGSFECYGCRAGCRTIGGVGRDNEFLSIS